MSNVKIVINRQGVRDLLHEGFVVDECKKYADRIYAACRGISGYEMKTIGGVRRKGYQIRAAAYPAIADNLKNNTLEKAKGSV